MASQNKVAIVGTGWWSTQAHIPSLLTDEDVQLILVDKVADKAQAAAHKYGVSHYYTSLTDALSNHPDLQGAVIAVPHAAHYEAAKEALECNLHILLEKPMTLHAKDARSLVELAAQNNLEILMGYTFPYLSPVREARKRMDDGLIGDIEYITCSMSSMTIEFLRGKPAEYTSVMKYPLTGPTEATYSDPALAGGGQGHLQITHAASLMFHLAEGLRAKTVCAFMNNLDTKVDVTDALAVRMTNGAVATVGSTGNLGKGDGGIAEVHLHGSKGRLLVDAISGRVHMRLHDSTEETIAPTWPAYPGEAPCQQFLRLLRGEAENFLPGSSVGLYTVELLDAAYRSAAQEGMPIRIESLYD